jgi:hypothetical protein
LRASSSRPDLAAICEGLKLRIANGTLTFYRRQDSPEVVALREALGLAPGFAEGQSNSGVIAANSGLSQNVNRLHEIRGRK